MNKYIYPIVGVVIECIADLILKFYVKTKK